MELDKKLLHSVKRASKIMHAVEFGCKIPGYFTGLGGNVTIKRKTKTMLVLRQQFSSCGELWYKQHSIPLNYLTSTDKEVEDMHIEYVLKVIQDRRNEAIKQALTYYFTQIKNVTKFKIKNDKQSK